MHIPEGIPDIEFYASIPQDERVVINEMQKQLMMYLLGDVHALDAELRWIDKYSKLFRDIITQHYELVEEYRLDEQKTLKRIESLLYTGERSIGEVA